MVPGEHVRRLGHEVHAAKDDVFGLFAGLRGVGQLEGVPHKVGKLHHLIALVEVPQHDDAFPKFCFRGENAQLKVGVGGLLVLLRELSLLRGGCGGRVLVGGTGAIAGGACERLRQIEFPGALGKVVVAALLCPAGQAPGLLGGFGLVAGDELDGGVYG